MMPKKKTRTAVFAGAAVLLLFGAAWLVVKHERTVHFQRLQGAWEGAMHFHWGRLMRTQRVVLHIFQDQGAYHAAVDEVDLGLKNLPVTQFDFGSRAVNFRLSSGVRYQGAWDGETMEIQGRWHWPGGNYAQPLALTRTNKPDAVQEPLTEAEYTPRPGSDLQGLWAGTWTLNKPLRLLLKIAEAPDGSFRAELNSIDEPPVIPIPITSLNYDWPHVQIGLQGIGARFEGSLNESHTRMAGVWTMAKATPITFDRVNPPVAARTKPLAPDKTN
jgi:hypothetical protein